MTANAVLQSQVTALIRTGTFGGLDSLNDLVPLIYDELHILAHRALARERPDHTLQSTALVHEAYMKMVDDTSVSRQGRAYFFGAAARAMRQVLVDHARRRAAAKRGAGAAPVTFDEGQVGVDAFAGDLLDLDGALDRLAALNPRQARVVECRYFGGLSVEETADALGVSPRTVKYDWALARSWLYRTLKA